MLPSLSLMHPNLSSDQRLFFTFREKTAHQLTKNTAQHYTTTVHGKRQDGRYRYTLARSLTTTEDGLCRADSARWW